MKFFDKLGVMVSSLCLIHCLLLPILIILLPATSTLFIADEGTAHMVLLSLVLVAGCASFIPGYTIHSHWGPMSLAAIGIAVLTYSAVWAHSHLGHGGDTWLSVIGSLVLISAHIYNHYRCKACASHSNCAHTSAPDVCVDVIPTSSPGKNSPDWEHNQVIRGIKISRSAAAKSRGL